MKIIFYYLFVLLAFAGCKKESEQRQLILTNDFKISIEVTLFPSSEYKSAPGMYLGSPIDNGYRLTKFNMNPGEEVPIFTDMKTSISPDSMMRMVFDSVMVTFNTSKLNFDHLMAKGYQSNIFQTNQNWLFKDVTYTNGTQWKSKKIYSSNNYFTFK